MRARCRRTRSSRTSGRCSRRSARRSTTRRGACAAPPRTAPTAGTCSRSESLLSLADGWTTRSGGVARVSIFARRGGAWPWKPSDACRASWLCQFEPRCRRRVLRSISGRTIHPQALCYTPKRGAPAIAAVTSLQFVRPKSIVAGYHPCYRIDCDSRICASRCRVYRLIVPSHCSVTVALSSGRQPPSPPPLAMNPR